MLKNALVSCGLKGMVALDYLTESSLLQDEPKVRAKEFKFPENAAGDFKFNVSLGKLCDFTGEVERVLHEESHEVAVKQEQVGIMKFVVEAIEIDDFFHLLKVHRLLWRQ